MWTTCFLFQVRSAALRSRTRALSQHECRQFTDSFTKCGSSSKIVFFRLGDWNVAMCHVYTARERECDRYREWDWHNRKQWVRYRSWSQCSEKHFRIIRSNQLFLAPFLVLLLVPVPCSVNVPTISIRDILESCSHVPTPKFGKKLFCIGE